MSSKEDGSGGINGVNGSTKMPALDAVILDWYLRPPTPNPDFDGDELNIEFETVMDILIRHDFGKRLHKTDAGVGVNIGTPTKKDMQ